jgi:hypothetical protein
MINELWTQLKVLVPLTALILLLLVAWRAPAFGWTYCIDIGGGTYCWDFPDE